MTNASEQDAALQALVPAASSGDPRALQKLINLIHPQVVRYCRARVGATKYPTADDIAQEVCLAVARAMPGYEDKGLPFMAFVYRVAANKIVDARRSQSRDLSQPVEDVPDGESRADNPESEMLMLDSCNDVSKLLDVVSDKAREILTLRIFGGYTAEETADILGMSAGAVRVAQFRALAKLRDHVEARSIDADVG
ncbi:sigma-70 family RNA polymerase sigma factor [Corynebacterium sp. zg254]|uniref:Sigma-70 family RNA polymerase sigma factor n=1 Tax=Corynebacterium zhongnanshanii TaxID=2768834 RepID=A0ABQ6VES1_9CORY|nr:MULTISPECIES: RNA polymerase sigma factor ShbA [Corynebacterium]KAB3522904.1 sigma-70 family RNA polymerase sigma factor [Corynebacterium zhongnanshanii]MCR5914021.1 sigma-70 family RNA polymerase sigma factor [Corynebacterium sp. zg254]